MLTFVLDRKRRGPASKPELLSPKEVAKQRKVTRFIRFREAFTWWWSKISVMIAMVVIQVTILSLTLYALGYHILGSTFGLLYLQLLFSGIEFAIFIGALWFFFRDDVIGKFIAIIFLIINLSSGWGTFPPSMQAPIFQVLSYIAPFTYAIKNIGAIVYGIGIMGANWQDQSFILTNIGIGLIYVVIGLIIGCFGCVRLTKMHFYGSRNKKKLAISLLEQVPAIDYAVYSLSYSYATVIGDSDVKNICSCLYDLNIKTTTIGNKKTAKKVTTIALNNHPVFAIDKNLNLQNLLAIESQYDVEKVPDGVKTFGAAAAHDYYVNWNKLKYGYDAEIVNFYNKRFPFDPKFKGWKKKNPDFVEIDDALL